MGETFHGNPLIDERNEFLEKTRQAKEKKKSDQKKQESALVIQRFMRMYVAKSVIRKKAL